MDNASANPADGRRLFLMLCALVVLLGGVVPLGGVLSSRPLDAHEIFVAQTSREMIANNDWLVPLFNEELRLKKPPLMYWLVITAAKSTPGTDEVVPWIARFPSLVSGMVLVGFTIALGVRVYGRHIGLISGLMAVTTVGYFTYTNSARPELLYAACCSIAIFGFVCAVQPEASKRSGWIYAMLGWVGVALACYAKGPHIPAIMLGGIVLFLALDRRLRSGVYSLHPVAGCVVLAALVLPWVIALALHVPQTVTVWIDELFGKSAASNDKGVLSYLSVFHFYSTARIMLPWSVLLPFGFMVVWQRNRPDLQRGRVLFWIALVTVVVMCIPNHRRVHYMLPLIPVLSVLMTCGTIDFIEQLARRRTARILAIISASVMCLAAAVVGVAVGLHTTSTSWLIAVLGGLLLAAAVVGVNRRVLHPVSLFGVPILAWALVFLSTASLHTWWGEQRYSEAAFAQDVERALPKHEQLLAWGADEHFVLYELDRPVLRVHAIEEVADFDQDGEIWILVDDAKFARIKEHWDINVVLDRPKWKRTVHDEQLLRLPAQSAVRKSVAPMENH